MDVNHDQAEKYRPYTMMQVLLDRPTQLQHAKEASSIDTGKWSLLLQGQDVPQPLYNGVDLTVLGGATSMKHRRRAC